MSQELHYTSVPRGLKPGSRGFCTVAATPGLSGPLLERLESLSAYQPVFPVHDPAAARNPVNFMHVKAAIGGKSLSVLSRVGPAGLDYSGRTNKYGHHIVLEPNERPLGGPAWLLSQPGFMQEVWLGEPRVLADGTRPPPGDRPPAVARAWQAATGDAGWAGVLAEAFLADPRRTAVVVFRPGMELLPLFVEAIALLPPTLRWDVEFSTFFSTLPPGVTCSWRGVIDGSPESEAALKLPSALVINLCQPCGKAEGRMLVQQARTGERPEAADALDQALSANPAGRPARSSTTPGAAPPSLRSFAASNETSPPVGLPGVTARPPSLKNARRAPLNKSRAWVIVATAAAVGLAGILGTVLFLSKQGGGLKVATDEGASPPTSPKFKPKAAIAVIPNAARPRTQPADQPAKSVSSPIASATGSGDPPAADTLKGGAGKKAQETPSEFVLVGPPRDPIPGRAPAPPAHPATGSDLSKPTPPIKANMVLEFILKEKGKESVLELPPSTQGPVVVKKLDLSTRKKAAKPSGGSLRAATGPSDQPALAVMATVDGALGSSDQAIARFKADGPKVTFNWDKAATDALTAEAEDFLRMSTLKIVTERNEVLYALLAHRPHPISPPIEIPDDVVEAARGRKKADLTLDVPWAVSLDQQFRYLQNRLVLLKMKAYPKGSSRELPLVEGDSAGQWICKGKAVPIVMTVNLKESDNKLRFVFPENPYLLESRVAEINRARSSTFKDGNALDPKDAARSDAPQKPSRLEDDLRLIQSLLGAQYRFVVGLRVDDKDKVVELVGLDESAPENTPQ